MTTAKPLPPLAPGETRAYPVLPLRDLVVFPHMIAPLFVGRKKSILALEEVMRSDTFHPARHPKERVRRRAGQNAQRQKYAARTLFFFFFFFLHRVYPAVTDVTEANCTGERAVSGGDAALVEANVRASLLEQRLSDLKAALNDMRRQRDDMREQRDRWQAQAERLAALAITDQRREAAPRSRSPGGDGCELERHRERAGLEWMRRHFSARS